MPHNRCIHSVKELLICAKLTISVFNGSRSHSSIQKKYPINCASYFFMDVIIHITNCCTQQEGTAKYATGTMDKKKNRTSGVRLSRLYFIVANLKKLFNVCQQIVFTVWVGVVVCWSDMILLLLLSLDTCQWSSALAGYFHH